MNYNEPRARMASGDAAAKAAWDRATKDLQLGRLDHLDGLTVVRMGETPRLQTIESAEPVRAASVDRSFVSILPTDPPKSLVFPAVVIVASLTGILGMLVTWMVGAS